MSGLIIIGAVLELVLGCKGAPPPEAPLTEQTASPPAQVAPSRADPAPTPPNPAPSSAERYPRACDTMKPVRGFDDTFMLGESCGQYVSLEAAIRGAQNVPRHLRPVYLDGVGHGLKIPEKGPQVLAERIRDTVPQDEQVPLHDGVIRAWTQARRGEPDVVVPWVRDYVRVYGVQDGRNGVRVGLQRSRGDDLADAIQVALRYPESWQAALLEELGWRAGNDVDEPSRFPLALVEPLSVDARCAFLRGAARGWSMNHPWSSPSEWASVAELFANWPVECSGELIEGLAWGLSIVYGTPAGWQSAVEAVPDPALRAALGEATQRTIQPEAAPIWGE